MHNFFKIPSSSIEKTFYHSFRNLKMTRVSIVSLSSSIFDIDDSDEPIVFSEKICIYSSFHSDIIVSMRTFTTNIHRTIPCTSPEFCEGRRHIGDSRTYRVIRECRSWSIGRRREDVFYRLRFWGISRADREVHRLFFADECISIG